MSNQQVLRVVRVTFSYEAYVGAKEDREEYTEHVQRKLRENLPKIDSNYTTGPEALKVERLTLANK